MYIFNLLPANELYVNLVDCVSKLSTEVFFSDNYEILVFGNFNLPQINWINSHNGYYVNPFNVTRESDASFLDEFSSIGFRQLNSIRNHNDRLLDLIFSSNESDFYISRSTDYIVSEDIHHPTIMLTLNFDVNAVTTSDGVYTILIIKTQIMLN